MTAPVSFRPRPFHPPAWARNPHVQTVGGKLLRPEPPVALRRERWDTPDGDFLLLDFVEDAPPGAPLVVVLHGLEGSARRSYGLLTYRALAHRGLAAVGLNFRSCGGEPNRRARFYHSGETGDLAWVLERLTGRFPGRPLGAVGFSLGGNVLLKMLGEGRHPEPLGAAATVSVPFDLDAGAAALEGSLMGRLYTRYFLRSLQAKAEGKAELLEEVVALEAVRSARTLREFDEAATAPLHGFRGAAHYYAESSSGRYLRAIRVPTLLLQSRDDPFLPERALPEAAVRANPFLVPAFSERGGHVGFVHGTPWRPRFHAEAEAARFIAGVLSG